MSDSSKYTMHDVARLFLGECRKYPDGHVLRSVARVDVRIYQNIPSIVFGISVGKNNDDTKMFNFTLDDDKIEEYVTNKQKRFDHVQLCAEQLYRSWSGDKKEWRCVDASQF